jgi:hypothetical protein
MSYTFTYTDPNDVEVSMCVPERSIDEMCEYFQRFLSACGYIFDEGEHIRIVPDKSKNDDVLTFDRYCGDFGDDNYIFVGSGLQGGMGEDHIQFSSYAAGPVPIPGASGKDIITFS